MAGGSITLPCNVWDRWFTFAIYSTMKEVRIFRTQKPIFFQMVKNLFFISTFTVSLVHLVVVVLFCLSLHMYNDLIICENILD